ncbi:MAG: multifunctional CCA addition/repair protein [Ignavibacteria bacterium]
MKTYLVGGAVRDQLLHYPVRERDWVVVGATPESMLQQGYQQVGRDFPVFLHPKTREEYALARKERKLAPGYYGFECDSGNDVSLEEDLRRRDLTINAMAMDDDGNLIDPYQGLQDLQQKTLRHVSDAFMEDPVRVLRVARFAARYHHLGFTLAAETRYLMYQMVKRGEVAHLVAERVWQELYRSLQEKNPEVFFSVLRASGALKIILPEIDALFGVPQTLAYHPEVDSGIHSLLVVKAAVELTTDPLIRFAALVHDLGKAQTPMTQWPSHTGHEERGALIIDAFCQRLRVPTEFRQFAMLVSRLHLLIHRIDELNADEIVCVFEQSDAFRRLQQFEQLLLVCEADAKGRLKTIDYWQRRRWQEIARHCLAITAGELVALGYQGIAIKQELHARRVACVNHLLNNQEGYEK